MRIVQLRDTKLIEQTASSVTLAGGRGERLRVSILDDDLVRVQHLPDGVVRFGRTWAIVDENGSVPREGRQRNDESHFPRPPCTIHANEQAVALDTALLQLTITLRDGAIVWSDRDGRSFAADLAGRAYPYDIDNQHVYHYMRRHPKELYYGFGERSGELDKHGRRLRFYNVDAMGYSAKSSDPLYKHWPFYITFIPERNIAYGLFYDNLATTIFDLGKEIDNYYPAFRSYRAAGGDIDYYLIYGPTIEDVVETFTALTGRMILPPRWSLGYLGSTMTYTDSPDAQNQLKQFVDLCAEHDIPCDMFHLSSGYSMADDGLRYVFEWNRRRLPNPSAMVDYFHQAGIRLAANIKPALLTSHPRYEEVAALGGFINEADDAQSPQLAMFWGGDGAHLDFTNPATYDWWQQRVRDALLEYGIDGSWNDNNEYNIENDAAVCAGFGEPIPLGLIRPLQPLLMTQASYEAQLAHKPDVRPYLLIRSGCVGLQRFAQSWTGDNFTSWETLRYNIPMGLGAGLSGIANVGHDVGGFAGGKPDAELFVRWVQHGIFMPRFSIHSWNDDGSVNEPWMYPEMLTLVREAIAFRYRLLPYLYSLFWESAEIGHPIMRPMVYHFAHDPACHAESFDFMLGPSLLVASVLEPNARSRTVYLPTGSDWCDFYTGRWWAGGQTIVLDAPLDRFPLLVRAGAIVPLGKLMRHVGEQPDDLRQLWLFPHPAAGSGSFTLVEDDGITLGYQAGDVTQLTFTLAATENDIVLTMETNGAFALPYQQLELILPAGEERPLKAERLTEIGPDEAGRRRFTIAL